MMANDGQWLVRMVNEGYRPNRSISNSGFVGSWWVFSKMVHPAIHKNWHGNTNGLKHILGELLLSTPRELWQLEQSKSNQKSLSEHPEVPSFQGTCLLLASYTEWPTGPFSGTDPSGRFTSSLAKVMRLLRSLRSPSCEGWDHCESPCAGWW